MMKLPTFGMFAILALSAGCLSEETRRMDGLTLNAGNAMASNTAMQMVDPWPAGVEDTDLVVPADPGRYRTAEAAAVAAERVDSSVDADK